MDFFSSKNNNKLIIYIIEKPSVKIKEPIVPKQVKVAFVGDSGIGKSSLVNYSIEDECVLDLETTNLVDIKFKKITLKENSIINYGIWDFSGKNDSNRIRMELYNELHAITYCFDLSNASSFKNLDNWVKEVKKSGGDKLLFVLVGLKSDLSHSVDKGQIQSFQNKYNIKNYYEVTIKDSSSIKKFYYDYGNILYDLVKGKK